VLPRVFTTSGRLAALADLGLYHVKTAAEFAPGIPSGKPISRLPSIKPTTLNRWTLAVQDHEATRAGRHYDLRLVDPDAGKAHSWAIPKARLPEPGEKLLAVQTFTHTPEYALHFGDKKPELIESGYGKGRVRMAVKAPVDIIEANNDKVRFNLYEGKQNNEYVLRRTRENKWLLQNVTVTRATNPNLPQSKPTYKETEPDKVDVTNDDQLMMAKVDGAHNTIQLNAGQPVRIFSYRPTERDTGIIEHTHRFLPGLTSRVPDHLDGLVLRGELFASDPHTGRAREAVETGAVLNSGVWKSRDTQSHSPLRAVVFDVARRNGKDVESVPYQEKLDILKRVNEALPFLELPPMAGTAKEKIQLLERIRSGREPVTSEGVVMWPLGGGPPVKAKFRPDHDVYVREVFPETGRREGLAGGFTYSWTPRGKIVGRVGTGITHDLKQDMLAHPEKYIGRVARVRALGLYTDKDHPKKPGALRAPSFQDWHLDKGMQPLEEKTSAESQEAIFRQVRKQFPDLPLRHASGGLPDARRLSDVDVSLFTPSPQELLAKFPAGTTETHDERRSVYGLPGYGRPVNIYATADPTLARRGVQHRNVERALAKQFPELAEKARALKQEGLGTEKAWATLLEVPGDPYEGMLQRQRVLLRAAHKNYVGHLHTLLAQAKVDPTQVRIGGSGILGALGLKRTHDLDVHVPDPKAFKALTRLPGATVDEIRPGNPRVRFQTPQGEIELFTGPWMVQDEDFGAAEVPTATHYGTPHWSPEHALHWKQRMNRPKDQPDIELLKQHLKTAMLNPAAHAYRERRGNCGPASLRIALRHHGLDAPEAVLAKVTQTTRRGTDPEAIAKVVGAKVREGMTLTKLRELTRAGTPVITAYQDGPARSNRNGHYSVVSKVDRYVHLSDPSSRKPIRKMTGAEFRARWHDVDQHGKARVRLGIPIKKVE
jgi:hypothetical protein